MRKLLIIFVLLFLPEANANTSKDCEDYVRPTLGINQYLVCLQNPSAYKEHFYYDVSFYDDAGLAKTQSVKYGQSASAPTPSSKSGYTFNRWNRSYSNITSDTTVTAIYVQNAPVIETHTITYKNFNGNTIKQETVEDGRSGNPPNVSRTGYDFTGWSGSYRNVTSDRTLFAQFSVSTYTVRFIHEGSVLKSETVNHNGNATPPNVPVMVGYNFVGWSGSYNNVKSSLDLTAVYEPVTYQVTFRSDDILKVEEVMYGEAATAPIATKPGYYFTGWDSSFSYVTEDMIVTAIFDPATYKVTFLVDGVMVKEDQVNYLGNAVPPVTSKEGYNLIGWDGNYNGITNDIVINAVFEPITYIVTYIDYDGSVYAEEVVPYNADAIGVTPVRIGFDFIGYSVPINPISSDKTVTLLYDAKLLNVVFVHNEDVIQSSVVEYNGCVNEPVFDVKGFSFLYWEGSLCNITEDVTISAITEQKLIPVTFKDYNGNTLKTMDVLYGETAEIAPPSREGYQFKGWSGSLVITDPITLIAQYTEKSYTVEFLVNGVVVKNEKVQHNKTAVAPIVDIEGYKFIEWDQEFQFVTSPLRVNAVLEVEKNQVVFMDYDMKELKREIVEYSKNAIPPVPTREGYVFTGWSDSFEKVTEDKTLIAQYKPIEYKVTLIIEEEVIDIVEVPYMKKFVLPMEYDWDFEELIITKDTTIYGRIKPCVNIYHLDETIEVPCDEEVEPILKEGYEFIRWEEGEDGYYPYYERLSLKLRFIHAGNIITQDVLYGDEIIPPVEVNGLKITEWDMNESIATDNVDIYGYVEPIDKVALEVEKQSNMFEFVFAEDISLNTGIKFLVNGEVRSLSEFEHSMDETGLFDRKMNWVRVTFSPTDIVEKLIINFDIEYRYNIDDYLKEETWYHSVLEWLKDIF